MDIEEKFDFIFVYGKSDTHEPQLWEPVLTTLGKSFLPQPDTLGGLERPEYRISGMLDERVRRAIRNEKLVLLTRTDGSLEITFQPVNRLNLLVSVKESFIRALPTEEVVGLFEAIVVTRAPLTARCGCYAAERKMLDEYYMANPRTPRVPGLSWLQYFGAAELALQGGEAILRNPYIEAEKLGDGLLVQVGETPFDVRTPEGEALLVQATNAMPPVVA